MTSRLLAAAVLLLVQGGTPHPAPEPRHFRYQRPLAPAPVTDSGQHCVTLDTTVFAHASSKLADLRLFAGPQEVPYAFYRASAPHSGKLLPPELRNLGEQNGHTVFDAHVFNPSYSTIEIVTKAEHFVASVDVSGSQSPAGPQTRIGTFTIFDLTDQQLPRSTVLHLPLSTFPYLHFRITGPIKPGDITGLHVIRVSTRPPAFTTVAESRRIAQRGRSSAVSFTVSGALPVERVTFVPGTPVQDFMRNVSIEIARPDLDWKVSFPGTILRVHTTRGSLPIDDERFSIDFPGNFVTRDAAPVRWTVTVDNRDDPPIPLAAVRIEMPERTVCFDATPGATYTLYYGDTVLAAPHYDYASLFTPVASPISVALGAERQNPGFQPRPDTRPITERYPALLWGVLVVILLVLGVTAVRAAARLPRRP